MIQGEGIERGMQLHSIVVVAMGVLYFVGKGGRSVVEASQLR